MVLKKKKKILEIVLYLNFFYPVSERRLIHFALSLSPPCTSTNEINTDIYLKTLYWTGQDGLSK